MNNNKHTAGSNLAAFVAGAAAALIAGGYFLYGPDGKRHRQQTGKLIGRAGRYIDDAKGELLERVAQAEDLTERGYRKLLAEVAKAQGLTAEQARLFVAKFKNKFEEIREEAMDSAEQAELELETEEE